MSIYESIYQWEKINKSFVVATVIKAAGSTPGKPGFKMIVDVNGHTLGTVGGGRIEKEVVDKSLKLLEDGESAVEDYILTTGKAPEKEKNVIPMHCEGKLSVFYEVYRSRYEIFIFGGGHVGRALINILGNLDYRITLIDNRSEFASTDKNPHANNVVCSDYIKYTREFNPNAESFIVVLTHGHEFDEDIVVTLLKRKLKLPYIGVISSRFKAQKMFEKLKKEFGTNADFSNIHMPIGLKIGGNSPAEIALSIAAQLQSVRYNKKSENK